MEAAGLVIGVMGLSFQFYNAAKEAYEVVSNIRNIGTDAAYLQTRLRVEQIRLETWAEQVGLTQDNPTLFEKRSKAKPVIYSVTLDILVQICDILTKHHDLESLYGLKSTEPQAKLFQRSQTAPPATIEITLPIAAWALSSQKAREQTLLEFQRRVSVARRLRWALNDKSKFEILITKLETLNNGLREILPPDDQRSLYRSLIMHQPSRIEELNRLSSVGAISEDYVAAANVKSVLLGSSSASGSSASSIDVNLVKIVSRTSNDARILGEIEENSVLSKVFIEYVELDDDGRHSSLDKYFQVRFQRLVTLLMIAPKPHGYRVLDCRGYFQEEKKTAGGRYGIVSSLPPAIANSSDGSMHSLYELLRNEKDNKPPVEFFLGDRFRLASLLANSVWHIHCAGWLHRSLRSGNVMCFSQTGEPCVKYPYLSGFNFARVDDTREVSKVEKSTQATLYQHPEYQGPSDRKPKYRRSYDFYSLGIILIEIGLWKQIHTFWRTTFDKHSFAAHLRSKVVPLLGHYMGNSYREAALICLESSLLNVGDDEGLYLSEAFSQRVVKVLENCRA